MAQQEVPLRRGSCLGRGAKILGMAILALGTIYFLTTINLRSLGLPIGDWPRVPLYVYTASKITLTFDGQEIVIEGTTRCRRRIEMDEDGDLRPLVFLDHIGFIYHCGPEWFGHRFEDGSALLTGAYSNAGAWRMTLSAFLGGVPIQPNFDGDSLAMQLGRLPPAVIWLDNAEVPTHAEYYYSMTALEDPRSRLTAIQQEVKMWPASLWTSLFTGRSPSDHLDKVSALVEPSSLYRMVGHYAVELPEDHWGTIDGLKEALADLSAPTLMRPPGQISKAHFEQLSAMALRHVRSLPPRFLRHGVAAPVPEEFSSGNSKSQLRFRAPIRSVAAETSEFRIFHFDDGLPFGALSMIPDTAGRVSDLATFLVGDNPVSGEYRLMWFGGVIYDPVTRTIHNLQVVSY